MTREFRVGPKTGYDICGLLIVKAGVCTEGTRGADNAAGMIARS